MTATLAGEDAAEPAVAGVLRDPSIFGGFLGLDNVATGEPGARTSVSCVYRKPCVLYNKTVVNRVMIRGDQHNIM
jgi:hypothetical protein